jgi:6-phosphogluconolactonase (cycloisomerase 2 family)
MRAHILAAAACVGCGGVDRAPAVAGLEPSSGIVGITVAISGDHFGDAIGQVRVGDVAARVTSWDDTEVRIELPDVLPGLAQVVVANEAGDGNAVEFGVVLPDAIYVSTNRSNDTIQTFALSRTDGTVTGFAPVDTGAAAGLMGGCAQTLAVHAPTRRLFATHNDKISVLDIDPRTGALRPIAGSPFAFEAAIGFRGVALDRAGRRMFVSFATEPATGGIRTFSIGDDGRPEMIADATFQRPPPVGGLAYVDQLALSNSERFLYTNPESTEGINGFSVAADGRLTQLAGSPFEVGIHAARGVAVRPGADQLLVSTDVGIYAFSFSDADGALVVHPQAPFTDDGISQNFVQLAWAGPDRVLVSASTFNPTPDFVTLQVGADGAPLPPATAPRVDIPRMFCMRVSADGAYLVGTGFEESTLGIVDVSTLAPLTGSPFRFAGTADPRGVATTF